MNRYIDKNEWRLLHTFTVFVQMNEWMNEWMEGDQTMNGCI